MARRKENDKNSRDLCEQVYEELKKVRAERGLPNVVFVFPRVLSCGKWVDPSGLVVGAIAKRGEIEGSLEKQTAFPIKLVGVEGVEVRVNHWWMKRFREVGCLSVEKLETMTRVKVPHEVADTVRVGTRAVVCVPPFHDGYTWAWPVVEALQETSSKLSGGEGMSWFLDQE